MTQKLNKIDRLIEKLCPNGVEYKELGEICTLIRGNGLQKKDFVEEGVGCIHYGQIYTHYGLFADKTKSFVSEEKAVKFKKAKHGDVLISGVSENVEDICTPLGWLGDEICISGDMFAFRHNQNTKFLTYILSTDDFQSYKKRFAQGTKVIRVNQQRILAYTIPVPPLPVQEEIVKILDTFTELEAELEAELSARKKQYDYYRDELLTFGDEVEWKTLGEVCEYVDYRGKTPRKTSEGIFLVTAKNIRRGFIDYDTSKEYIDKNDFDIVMRRGLPKIGDVLITTEAPCGFVAQIDRENIALAQRVIKYRSKNRNLTNSFIKHYLLGDQFQEKLQKTATGSTVKGIKGSKLHKLKIPIPPLSEQERIVSILDKFDALVNDISAGLPAEIDGRRKQYEYYRNKLLTFRKMAG